MTIAAGARVRLVYGRESTRGTTFAGTTKILRTTSRNINLEKNMLQSQEIRETGQVHDLRHGWNHVEGQIGAELALNTQDDMLESSFGSLWASNVLKIGTTPLTHSFERQFPDVARYEVFAGVVNNRTEFRIQPEAIVGITYTILGMKANTPSGTPIAVTPTAAPTDSPFDSFTGLIEEGGVSIATVTGLTFNIDHGRSLGAVVASKFSPDVFEGTTVVTGEVTAYFEDHSLYTKFVNESTSSMKVRLDDPVTPTTSMEFFFGKIKYTGNRKDPTGTGPVIQTMPFQAVYDTVTGTSVQLTRDLTP